MEIEVPKWKMMSCNFFVGKGMEQGETSPSSYLLLKGRMGNGRV